MKDDRDTIYNQRRFFIRAMVEWSWETLEAKSTHLCAWLDWTQNSHLYLCIAGILPGNIFWKRLFNKVRHVNDILELHHNPKRKVFNYVVVDMESERSCDLIRADHRVVPTMKHVGECPEEPYYTWIHGNGYSSYVSHDIMTFPNPKRHENEGKLELYKQQVEQCPMVPMVKTISFKPQSSLRHRNNIRVASGEIQTFRMLNAASIVNKTQNQNKHENIAKAQLV